MEALRAGPELARRLGAAQEQQRQEGARLVVEVEHLVEHLPVLGLPGAVARVDDPGQAHRPQLGQGGRDLGVGEVQDRVPARGLVARRAQPVERHGVGVRDRALLLEEAADDPLLHRVQVDRFRPLHGRTLRRPARPPGRRDRRWGARAYDGAMTALVIVLASVVAVAAAIRSTWSPCGLSMLSTITPLGEQARRYRWAGSAAWFIAGAVLGGATLALGAAVLAAGVAALDLSDHARRRSSGGAGRRHHGLGPAARRLPAAVAHAAGERVLAGPVPQLGLRRGLRLADRRRARHLRHHLGRLPDDRPGRPHGVAPRGLRGGDGLRARARPGRPARPRPDHAAADAGAAPAPRRAAAHRPASRRARAGRRPGRRRRGRLGARPGVGLAVAGTAAAVGRRPRPAQVPGAPVAA